MGTEKRARQKANRAARKVEVQEEEAKEHREESTKKFGKWIVIAVAIIALIVIFQVVGGDDDDGQSTVSLAPETEQEEEQAVEVPEIVYSDTVPADFEPFAGEGALSLVEPALRNGVYSAEPPTMIEPNTTYAAVLSTSIGAVRLSLFADEAPVAVNNFISLASDGFYLSLIHI